MVYDVILFNNEHELFDLRYNILKDKVDEFIVCEARTTFSGQPKQLTFNPKRYKKVKYFIIPDEYTEDEKRLAAQSPNTIGASHWTREFLQKEKIKEALTHLLDEDLVYIGDCDEIWLCVLNPKEVVKLKLDVYTYWLNNKSSEQFWGTICGRYVMIKEECLNHLRVNARKTEVVLGWHFTSLAPYLKQKLLDSYTSETYANKQVLDNLVDNMYNGRDFLGRDFTYELSEENWPEYLTNNRGKYKELIK